MGRKADAEARFRKALKEDPEGSEAFAVVLRIGRLALAATFFFFMVRLNLAQDTGFFDGEALVASTALFPQPAYLEAPGLAGAALRLIGAGAVPDPFTAHLAAASAVVAIPWLAFIAALAAGASLRPALATPLAALFCPALILGLQGVSPDLLATLTATTSLALALALQRSRPGSRAALALGLGLGVSLGLGALASVTGVVGLVVVAWVLLVPAKGAPGQAMARPLLESLVAVVLAAILAAPLAAWELRRGAPMAFHWLKTGPGGPIPPGPGLGWPGGTAAVLAGLLLVGPPLLFGAGLLLRDLANRRSADPASRLLFSWAVTLLAASAALGLWSHTATITWVLPGFVALTVHAGRDVTQEPGVFSRRTGGAEHPGTFRAVALASLVAGAVMVVAGWLYLKPPWLQSWSTARLDRVDPSHEIHAWEVGLGAVRESLQEAAFLRQPVVVVGAHPAICGQLRAGLPRRVDVGCHGPPSDFDRWLPRARWRAAPLVLYVSDSRFSEPATEALPGRKVLSIRSRGVRRGQRRVRTISAVLSGLPQGVARR